MMNKVIYLPNFMLPLPPPLWNIGRPVGPALYRMMSESCVESVKEKRDLGTSPVKRRKNVGARNKVSKSPNLSSISQNKQSTLALGRKTHGKSKIIFPQLQQRKADGILLNTYAVYVYFFKLTTWLSFSVKCI